MADGRVARLTKTQSDFGVQIDSLADTITFGVALRLSRGLGGLSQFGGLGLFTVFYVSKLRSHSTWQDSMLWLLAMQAPMVFS